MMFDGWFVLQALPCLIFRSQTTPIWLRLRLRDEMG